MRAEDSVSNGAEFPSAKSAAVIHERPRPFSVRIENQLILIHYHKFGIQLILGLFPRFHHRHR